MDKTARELRKEILYLSHRCGDGNLQSAFSCVDILWALYSRVMDWQPDRPLAQDRDIFIISKGQATLALYPVLIRKGLFCMEEVADRMGEFDSRYCIQTDVTKFAGGIENNAGSLGHGLPFATGIAMANKARGLDSRVYVLCGDGEFTEGTMWESCILAGSRRLDNLCVIIDDNDSVGAMVDMDSMAEKLRAFRFDVYEANGHNYTELCRVLDYEKKGRPAAVIAHTVRGFGSPTMMEDDIWFHKAPNEQELISLQEEVDRF